MAVDMFLKLEGIDGESEDHAHEDEIDVLSWAWGANQEGSFHLGGGGGAGKVHFQDLSVTKYVDLASPVLMFHCARGKHIPEGILTVRKAGESPIEYMVVTMKKVLVSSVQTGGSNGGDRLTETVTLNFAECEMKYTEETEEGAEGASKTFSWNVAKNDGDVS
jgi:type VI secretion system secreted protein Hcp